ncbi:subtilisin-like protease SBT6.1 [Vigna umbellata]|uniref:subtilisin-like protease SBT6.1 n=1 Tax=Vigna umbellata TaxID=87088 RepID=UPI001F5E50F2|nr:subtilisin-like protease SBT6.1 [Vigna umbellata]
MSLVLVVLFSSRDMSTWELPHGYGCVRPGLVGYGRGIMGSKVSANCKRLSGTSVTGFVVIGVVCLLVSVIPEPERKSILNQASMKQALVEGAGPNMYEQGAGRVDMYVLLFYLSILFGFKIYLNGTDNLP